MGGGQEQNRREGVLKETNLESSQKMAEPKAPRNQFLHDSEPTLENNNLGKKRREIDPLDPGRI